MNELLLLLSLFTATVFGTVDTENETTQTENTENQTNSSSNQTETPNTGIPKIVVFMNN